MRAIELGTRIRYEAHRCTPAERETTHKEGVIISSIYDGKDAPFWQYDVSTSGTPTIELDHYPFEIWTDLDKVDAPDITDIFDEEGQQWQIYMWR